jgi:hypothetical protein
MITVSIVAYKTDLKELAKCLDSLSSPLVSSIYVVDNSNLERIADFCKSYPKVIYIGSENVGYGAGHNKALRTVLSNKSIKYHLVVNSDVYFEPVVIDKLAEYMNQNPDVAQVHPYVTYPNGELQYTCRLLPTPANLIFRRFLPKNMIEAMDERYTLKFWNHRSEANIPYHQGSFMFFRTSAFEKTGLFDERFFMYPEDIDITRRMHQNFRTMFWPGVTIVHAHRAASYKSKKMLKIHMVNMVKYFTKWGWIFDRQRKVWNSQLLKELGYEK